MGTIPTGQVSIGDVNTALEYGANSQRSLGDPRIRDVSGKSSGQISLGDLRGKTYASAIPLIVEASSLSERAGGKMDWKVAFRASSPGWSGKIEIERRRPGYSGYSPALLQNVSSSDGSAKAYRGTNVTNPAYSDNFPDNYYELVVYWTVAGSSTVNKKRFSIAPYQPASINITADRDGNFEVQYTNLNYTNKVQITSYYSTTRGPVDLGGYDEGYFYPNSTGNGTYYGSWSPYPADAYRYKLKASGKDKYYSPVSDSTLGF